MSKPSSTNNDRIDHKNRSVHKKKRKVIKQVYRVKRDGRLNKNSDLTLDREKLVVKDQSVDSIDKIVPNNDRDSQKIVEQCLSLAGGKSKRETPGLLRPV